MKICIFTQSAKTVIRFCTFRTCSFHVGTFLCRPLWKNRDFNKRQREWLCSRSEPWLVAWGEKIVRHVLHAFWCYLLDEVCQTTTWNFQIWGSSDNATHNRKSFILCLYVKTVRSNQVKEYFTYFLQSDQHGIITRYLTTAKYYLTCRSCRSSCRSFLNSLTARKN